MISQNSTDQQLGDTSKYTQRVLLSDHGTITTSAPGGGATLYYGSLAVDLTAYDFGVYVPEVEVYASFPATDANVYYKTPFSSINLVTGAASTTVSYLLQRGGVKGTTYTLRLLIFVSSVTNNLATRVDYQIKSTPAAPLG